MFPFSLNLDSDVPPFQHQHIIFAMNRYHKLSAQNQTLQFHGYKTKLEEVHFDLTKKLELFHFSLLKLQIQMDKFKWFPPDLTMYFKAKGRLKKK